MEQFVIDTYVDDDPQVGVELGVVQEHPSPMIEHEDLLANFPRIQMEWRNIACRVHTHSKEGTPVEKEILKGVSGCVKPGQLLAIMGSTGAGKTTLLNILSQRINSDSKPYEISGNVLYNGEPVTREIFAQNSAYVTQHDLIMSTLTPRESLEFCAHLKLPAGMSDERKFARVNRIIRSLRIQKCADTVIGDERKKGISGGERKRACIGVELVSNPSLIFLDEPTTGLDSFTALKLLVLLRNIASTGRSIVLTIHQPTWEMFEHFDSLILMSGGNTVYNGPASEASDYFASMGYPCPPLTNPADHFLRILEHHSEDNRRFFYSFYQRSHMAVRERYPAMNEYPALTDELYYERASKTKEFSLLFQRNFKNYIRRPETLKLRVFEMSFIAFFLGFLYFDLGFNQASITQRLGLLFQLLIYVFISSIVSVCDTFPLERPLMLKEVANGLYTLPMYFVSKLFSEVSFQLIYPCIFATIIYFLSGLNSEIARIVVFFCCTIVVANVGMSIGLLIGSQASRPETGKSLIPLAIIPFSLVCGLFILVDEIPTYMIWMRWISVFRYGYEIYVLNEFGDMSLYCDDDEYVTDDDGSSYCEFTTGSDVLEYYDMSDVSIGLNFVILISLYVFCLALAYFGLTRRKH